jgi:hypothetical protein
MTDGGGLVGLDWTTDGGRWTNALLSFSRSKPHRRAHHLTSPHPANQPTNPPNTPPAVVRDHIDDEYAHAGERDPKVGGGGDQCCTNARPN